MALFNRFVLLLRTKAFLNNTTHRIIHITQLRSVYRTFFADAQTRFVRFAADPGKRHTRMRRRQLPGKTRKIYIWQSLSGGRYFDDIRSSIYNEHRLAEKTQAMDRLRFPLRQCRSSRPGPAQSRQSVQRCTVRLRRRLRRSRCRRHTLHGYRSNQ